jgi:hypothetical protein
MAVRSRESSASLELELRNRPDAYVRRRGLLWKRFRPARVNQLTVQGECTSVCWASDSLKISLMVSADC